MESSSDHPINDLEKPKWAEMVLAALLEMDWQKLPERIAQARAEVNRRSTELIGKEGMLAERSELRDAMHTLQSLQTMVHKRTK